ncbi:flagellar export protein FliJ [Paramixta manurensis]|uniref:Flagellar FliJ protein n=1 Tax=Paramixta manurensis TaxID=2740817 RepID=A0A6M8U7W9_9GAMM|nr:flagellar export protein FliJ [Erwiniaceae bacterium PD-1]
MPTSKMINVLERLRQMREREVNELTGQLARQRQLCQRYHNNITALNNLCHQGLPEQEGAVQLMNQSRYKTNIQRVIAWQEQEQALADLKAQRLRQDLTQQACREKTVDVVLQQQREALARARAGREQKATDGLALQSWLRNQPKNR